MRRTALETCRGGKKCPNFSNKRSTNRDADKVSKQKLRIKPDICMFDDIILEILTQRKKHYYGGHMGENETVALLHSPTPPLLAVLWQL